MFLFENSLEFKWEVINKIWESDILKGSLAMTQSLRKEKKNQRWFKTWWFKRLFKFFKSAPLYITHISIYEKKEYILDDIGIHVSNFHKCQRVGMWVYVCTCGGVQFNTSTVQNLSLSQLLPRMILPFYIILFIFNSHI